MRYLNSGNRVTYGNILFGIACGKGRWTEKVSWNLTSIYTWGLLLLAECKSKSFENFLSPLSVPSKYKFYGLSEDITEVGCWG
jgi:hypothetical protein